VVSLAADLYTTHNQCVCFRHQLHVAMALHTVLLIVHRGAVQIMLTIQSPALCGLRSCSMRKFGLFRLWSAVFQCSLLQCIICMYTWGIRFPMTDLSFPVLCQVTCSCALSRCVHDCVCVSTICFVCYTIMDIWYLHVMTTSVCSGFSVNSCTDVHHWWKWNNV
jgi:hypothetical protein